VVIRMKGGRVVGRDPSTTLEENTARRIAP